jgi:hypothetical protein
MAQRCGWVVVAGAVLLLLQLLLVAEGTSAATCPSGAVHTDVDSGYTADYRIYKAGRQVKQWHYKGTAPPSHTYHHTPSLTHTITHTHTITLTPSHTHQQPHPSLSLTHSA